MVNGKEGYSGINKTETMADHLVRVYGTEEDRVNCPFYFKIGACRHGDRCTRKHNRPSFSQTLLIKQFYQNPKVNPNFDNSPQALKQIQDQFDEFYMEIFDELSTSYGPIEELHICDNINEHMLGNVYVKFEDEEDAQKALQGLSGRFYAGRPIAAEYSPVTDFREARCRQHEEGQCTRGGYCNFMHLMTPSQGVFYHCFPKGRWGYTREERLRDKGPLGNGVRNLVEREPTPEGDRGDSRDDRSRHRSRYRSDSRDHSRSRRHHSHRRRSPSRSNSRDHRRRDRGHTHRERSRSEEKPQKERSPSPEQA